MSASARIVSVKRDASTYTGGNETGMDDIEIAIEMFEAEVDVVHLAPAPEGEVRATF